MHSKSYEGGMLRTVQNEQYAIISGACEPRPEDIAAKEAAHRKYLEADQKRRDQEAAHGFMCEAYMNHVQSGYRGIFSPAEVYEMYVMICAQARLATYVDVDNAVVALPFEQATSDEPVADELPDTPEEDLRDYFRDEEARRARESR